MTKDRIYLEEAPAGTPAEFLEDGVFALDLQDNFSFLETRQVEELNDINQIKGSGVLGFSMPYTTRNRFAFQRFFSPNIEDNAYEPIRVRAVSGTGKVLPQELLFVRGLDDSSKEIEVELIDENVFWVKAAEELKLSEIPMPTRPFTLAEISNRWGDHQYRPDDDEDAQVVNYPLCHYGGWLADKLEGINSVLVEDFKPWHSIPWLLVRGFRHLGWTFESELLETDWFCQLYAYLLNKDLIYPGKGQEWRVYALWGVDENVQLIPSAPNWLIGGISNYLALPFRGLVTDPKGQHQLRDLVSGGVVAGQISDFANLTNGTSDFLIEFVLVIENNTGGEIKLDVGAWVSGTELDVAPDLIFPNGETTQHYIELKVNMDFGQVCNIILQGASIDGVPANQPYEFTIKGGTQVTFRPNDPSRLYRDEQVDTGAIVNPNLTFLDFFKGIVHLIAGKVETDFSEYTVRLFPPDRTKVSGQVLEGFMLPYSEAIDVTNAIQLESRRVSFEAGDARYIELKFSNSSDAYIRDVLQRENDDLLYSRTIDLGPTLPDRKKRLENPFFEPTANTSLNRVMMPALWDNSDGSISRSISPRIIQFLGMRQQDGGDGQAAVLVFENSSIRNIPYAFQFFERKARIESPIGSGSPFFLPVGGVLYGVQVQDLYEMFWRFQEYESAYSPVYSFDCYMDPALYEQLSFRRRLFITYGGESFSAKLIAIRDWQTGINDIFTIDVKPEVQLYARYLNQIKDPIPEGYTPQQPDPEAGPSDPQIE